jgi:hypothetical protein
MSLPSTVPEATLTCRDVDCALAVKAADKIPNITSDRGSIFIVNPFVVESMDDC